MLAAIKEYSMNYEASEHIHRNFINLKQNREESITDYSARFKAAIRMCYGLTLDRISLT